MKFSVLITSMLFLMNQASAYHVGVFCATDNNIPDSYKQVAFDLGKSLAQKGHSLTTGGGNTGLMNAVTNGFISTGDVSRTHAVTPIIFKDYNAHHLDIPHSNLVWTETIHQRLQEFDKQCNVMVVLPGGFGTLHELMDFLVPKQWGLTDKQIILLNTDHFWDHLLMQFQTMVEKKTLKQKHLDLLIVVADVAECMEAINNQSNTASHHGLNDRYWESEN